MKFRKILALSLAFFLFAALLPATRAADAEADALSRAAAYVQKTDLSNAPLTVLALVQGDCGLTVSTDSSYLSALRQRLIESDGVLSRKQYTEYSKNVLALLAMGEDPAAYAGYDLVTPLRDFDTATLTGISGAVYALLALDAVNCDKDAALRQRYVDFILSKQLDDGGFAVLGQNADPDTTSMVLQALAAHREDAAVQAAIQQGLAALDTLWTEQGYVSFGSPNAESCAQVVIALTTLGIAPTDAQIACLLSYQLSDGSFCHVSGGTSNARATEQGLMALAALRRFSDGRSGLFVCADAYPAALMTDLTGHWSREAVAAAMEKGLFSGVSEKYFAPNVSMTRAMLVTVLWRHAGCPKTEAAGFADIPENAYYAEAAAWAKSVGISEGLADGSFGGTLQMTREQLAVFLMRYAELSGAEVNASGTLDAYPDGNAVSAWAQEAMVWATSKGLLQGDAAGRLHPQGIATRAEVATVLVRFLALTEA